jgi:hypothetical protein
MDKVKIFMFVTAIISAVVFKFNKFLDIFISLLCEHICDKSMIATGPYINSTPVVIKYAMIDGTDISNKLNFVLNWKWNFDFHGFYVSDIHLISPGAKEFISCFTNKYTGEELMVHLNFENNVYFKNNIRHNIPFGEIRILENLCENG